jgi:hypothetical protein
LLSGELPRRMRGYREPGRYVWPDYDGLNY